MISVKISSVRGNTVKLGCLCLTFQTSFLDSSRFVGFSGLAFLTPDKQSPFLILYDGHVKGAKHALRVLLDHQPEWNSPHNQVKLEPCTLNINMRS